MGTMSGGSAMKRSLPSTCPVSFLNARMLSRVRALATPLATPLASFLPSRSSLTSVSTHSSIRCISMWEYHTSSEPRFAAFLICSRYSSTAASTTSRRSERLKDRSRPAISKLAARRLTSHSQGPGRVSSKSLMSNISWRSGEANRPKLERWASPQHWTTRPVRGVEARSAAMIEAAPR